MLNNTLYAGIDLHKKYMYVTLMNKDGQIHYQGRHENQDHTLIPALLEYNMPIQATVESTYGWYWLADDLSSAHISCMLAHPKKINLLVGKKKTDKEDSKALAELLRANLLPQSYIPSKEERQLKELLRFRMGLVQQQSNLKRRLWDILAKQNIACEYSDILGSKAQQWLSNLKCPYPYQEEIDSLLTLSLSLKQQITDYNQQVKQKAKENSQAQLLLSVPGIGDILALTLAVEIGDINRFASDRALASYAGVVPSVHSSGDKTHYGPTGKRGNPYIRWALAEAMVHILNRDPYLKEFYERIRLKKGSATARVAVMNRMLRSIYAMLTKKQTYLVKPIMKPTDSNQNN